MQINLTYRDTAFRLTLLTKLMTFSIKTSIRNFTLVLDNWFGRSIIRSSHQKAIARKVREFQLKLIHLDTKTQITPTAIGLTF